MESEKNNLQKEIANLKEVEIVHLKQENEKINKNKEEQEKLAQDLESEKKTLETEVSNTKEMLESVKNLCHKLEEQNTQQSNQNASLKTQLEEERATNSTKSFFDSHNQ